MTNETTKPEASAEVAGRAEFALLCCPSCGCDQIQLEERRWVKPFARYCRNCRMYGPIAKTTNEANKLWNELPRNEDLEEALREATKNHGW